MGLFKKENCSICGQPKGLLGAKLADGNCVCSKCQDTGREYPFYRVELYPRRELREMTLDEFKQNQALVTENREKLAQFEPTVSYKGIVQIDEDSNELVFSDDLEHTKANTKDAVLVHHFGDLLYTTAVYHLQEVKEGLLKDHVIADIILLAIFDEPITKLYAVTLQKKARLPISGVFNKSYATDEETDKLMAYLKERVQGFSPDSPQEAAFWEGISCAKANGYFESPEVADMLKLYYWGDKPKIKEIRKRYKL